MIGKRDLRIITRLRQNARESLTDMSKQTAIPISSIYDKIRHFSGAIIKKHTTLLDFSKLGFHARANIAIKASKHSRDALREYLVKSLNINSVCRTNNGYDFIAEGIFRHVKDMEDYLDKLEKKFDIEKKQLYYIIDDIKKEEFMNDEKLLDVVV